MADCPSAIAIAGIPSRPIHANLLVKWSINEAVGEALGLTDGMGEASEGDADAEGVAEVDGSSWCVARTFSTEPPLANSGVEASTFTSPGSFAAISTVPLLSPALTTTVDVSLLPLGDRPSTWIVTSFLVFAGLFSGSSRLTRSFAVAPADTTVDSVTTSIFAGAPVRDCARQFIGSCTARAAPQIRSLGQSFIRMGRLIEVTSETLGPTGTK